MTDVTVWEQVRFAVWWLLRQPWEGFLVFSVGVWVLSCAARNVRGMK